MLGQSQQLLLLGFLYVNDSFPWTVPSSSQAQAQPQPRQAARPPSSSLQQPGAGCCNRTPCHWRRAESLCCFPAEPRVKHPPPSPWAGAVPCSPFCSAFLGSAVTSSHLTPSHRHSHSRQAAPSGSSLQQRPCTLCWPSPRKRLPVKPSLEAAVPVSIQIPKAELLWQGAGRSQLFQDPLIRAKPCTAQAQEAALVLSSHFHSLPGTPSPQPYLHFLPFPPIADTAAHREASFTAAFSTAPLQPGVEPSRGLVSAEAVPPLVLGMQRLPQTGTCHYHTAGDSGKSWEPLISSSTLRCQDLCQAAAGTTTASASVSWR